jgi:hypothetical protein
MISICIFLFFVILLVWKSFHVRLAEKQFRYSLFKVRDDLRMLAINNEIDKSSKIFTYLDETFSSTIKEHYNINIYTLLFVELFRRDKQKEFKFLELIDEACRNNKELEKLVINYIDACREYIFDQNFVSFKVIIKPIVISIFGVKSFAAKINDFSKRTLVSPYSSAFTDYSLN